MLLISEDLDEIRALSDRIVVIYEGQLTGEFDPGRATVEEIGLAMAGGERSVISVERRLEQTRWLGLRRPARVDRLRLRRDGGRARRSPGHDPVDTYRRLFNGRVRRHRGLDGDVHAATPLLFTGLAPRSRSG